MTNLDAQRRSSQQRGFTLIELLAVVAMITSLVILRTGFTQQTNIPVP
jgi:prepilin-type N-terminal cleavage/methylation domain-containing protein